MRERGRITMEKRRRPILLKHHVTVLHNTRQVGLQLSSFPGSLCSFSRPFALDPLFTGE